MSDGPSGPRPPRDPHRAARYYRTPRRTPRWLSLGVWALWLSLGAGLGIAFSGFSFVQDTVEQISPNTRRVQQARRVVDRVVPGKPENILLIGSDSRGKGVDYGRSDSIILVHMDSQLGFISMLSFARDLWVDIPGHGTDKINAAYSIGEQGDQGGPAKVIETVQKLTGQPVNGYVNVDFKGFSKLVDRIGGVYIDVDRRYFNDNSGSEKYEMIDLEPGYQRLMGDDALDYVRYRHTDSDFARIARQQSFLSELKRRTRGRLSQGPEFVRLIGDNAETDINNAGRLLNLIRRAIDTPDDRVFRVQVNGDQGMVGQQSVNFLNQSELQDAMQQWLNPPFLDNATVKVDPTAVSVAVLNGSGRSLVSEDMAELLRGKGYRALSAGNAPSFGFTGTTVQFAGERQESTNAARALKNILGPSAVMEQVAPSDLAGNTVNVVVGSDFTGQLYAPPPPPKPDTADTFDSAALVPTMRQVGRLTGMNLMAPLKFASGSSLRRMRMYRINSGGKGPWAVKLVFHRYDGGDQYWGVMATEMEDPPILAGRAGVWKKRGGLVPTRLFYNGKLLTRESFEYRGIRYWISNSLNPRNALSAETMHAIARSFRPAATAKLPKGIKDAGMSVEYDAPTP